MSLPDLFEATVGGIALGCLFGLIAVGYSLVYGSARLINFAHGEFFVVGGYCFIFLVAGPEELPGTIPVAILLGIAGAGCFLGVTKGGQRIRLWKTGLRSTVSGLLVAGLFLALASLKISVPVAAILGGGFSAVVASASERFVYRPMAGMERLRFLVAALGLSFALRGFLEITVGGERRTVPGVLGSTNPSLTWLRSPSWGGALANIDVIIVLFTVCVTAVLWQTSRRTRIGLAVRAIGEVPEVARNMGVDIDQVRSLVFALGGLLAGLACFFFFARQGFLEPSLGYSQGIVAFAAAVIGGIGRIQGALIGGLVIGLVVAILGVVDVEPLAAAILPESVVARMPSLDLSDWSLGVVYAVMILVFLFRERGIIAEEQWRAL